MEVTRRRQGRVSPEQRSRAIERMPRDVPVKVVTIRVREQLHRQVKVLAAVDGCSLELAYSRAVAAGLAVLAGRRMEDNAVEEAQESQDFRKLAR